MSQGVSEIPLTWQRFRKLSEAMTWNSDFWLSRAHSVLEETVMTRQSNILVSHGVTVAGSLPVLGRLQLNISSVAPTQLI
jgi:hypothetical protein